MVHGDAMRQTITRNHMDGVFTFDLESLFENAFMCEQQMDVAVIQLAELTKLDANPVSSANTLHTWLQHSAKIEIMIDQVYLYAMLLQGVDRNNLEATRLMTRASDLVQQCQKAFVPLNITFATLTNQDFQAFCKEIPELYAWAHDYTRRARKVKYRVSSELEQLIPELDTLAAFHAQQDQMLLEEIDFGSITDSQGNVAALNLDNFFDFYRDSDFRVRAAAQQNYLLARHKYRNTSVGFLYTFMKTQAAKARMRNYSSNLEMAFTEADIATNIFSATLESCMKNKSVWLRYWAARRRLLGLSILTTSDLGISLEPQGLSVSYEQAVKWIVAAVRPLGDDYADQLERGLTIERWVDVYPSEGKKPSAYCWTTDGCKPYIMISYQNDFKSLSTLAHEAGHAMHSFYTFQNQPRQYASYGQTAAEIAANVHQALLFSYLRNVVSDAQVNRAALLTELRVSKHYLMQMPLNAAFEHDLYQRVWLGEGFVADDLCAKYLAMAKETNGETLELSALDAVEWLDESVMYGHYGALQYTLGISGAQAIVEKILNKVSGAVDGYRKFLCTGNSMGQLESLSLAGIDFATPKTIDLAFKRVSELIDVMESLPVV